MLLVLGELGVVATVTCVDDGVVRTAGAALHCPTSCGIDADGSMSLERALTCELACDWDPAWERADYYSCDDDPDELDGVTPEGALFDYFNPASDDPGVSEWIRRVCPLEVTAYKRDVVSDVWLTNMAAELVEQLEENYALEYGAHPERRPFDDNRHEVRSALIAKIREVIAETVARVQPYNCTAVASRLFDAHEVERVLRVDADWFEKAAASQHDTIIASSFNI